jgi:hypothetical protein
MAAPAHAYAHCMRTTLVIAALTAAAAVVAAAQKQAPKPFKSRQQAQKGVDAMTREGALDH